MKPLRRIVAHTLFSLLAAASWADGTTDFVIDLAAGYVIGTAGSYRLTADAAMTDNVAAISITTSNVTLDLGGHTITGAPGTGFPGVLASGAPDVTIINGTIRFFGGWGIEAGTRAVIRDVRLIGNNRNGGTGGIYVSTFSVVDRCILSANNPTGAGLTQAILTGSGTRVSDCSISSHTTTSGAITGIATSGSHAFCLNNIIRGNVATGGNFTGISLGSRCTARGNQVVANQANAATATGIDAFTAGSAALIEGNVCSENTSGTSGSGGGQGIAAADSLIINNECSGNSALAGTNGFGVGIYGVSGSKISGNHCSGNRGNGTGVGSGITVVNSCTIEDNQLIGNGSGGTGWGVRASGSGHVIARNSFVNNGSAAMNITVSTNNRAHSNQIRQSVTFDASGSTPISVGVGDLANVVF